MLGSIIGAVLGSSANKKAANAQAAAAAQAAQIQADALRESTRMQIEASDRAQAEMRAAQTRAITETRGGTERALSETRAGTKRAQDQTRTAGNRGIDAVRAGAVRYAATMQPLTQREAEFYNPNFRLGLTENQTLAREDLQRQGRATIAKSGLRGAGRAGAAAILNADQRFMAQAAADNDQLNRNAQLTNINLRESARDKRNAATADLARMYGQEGSTIGNIELGQGNRIADMEFNAANRIAGTELDQANRVSEIETGVGTNIARNIYDTGRSTAADTRMVGNVQADSLTNQADARARATLDNARLWSGVAGEADGLLLGAGLGAAGVSPVQIGQILRPQPFGRY